MFNLANDIQLPVQKINMVILNFNNLSLIFCQSDAYESDDKKNQVRYCFKFTDRSRVEIYQHIYYVAHIINIQTIINAEILTSIISSVIQLLYNSSINKKLMIIMCNLHSKHNIDNSFVYFWTAKEKQLCFQATLLSVLYESVCLNEWLEDSLIHTVTCFIPK